MIPAALERAEGMFDQRFALCELIRLSGNPCGHPLQCLFIINQPLDATRTFRFRAPRAQLAGWTCPDLMDTPKSAKVSA
jgi:hypothetical protein